jgi:hypothetical protein
MAITSSILKNMNSRYSNVIAIIANESWYNGGNFGLKGDLFAYYRTIEEKTLQIGDNCHANSHYTSRPIHDYLLRHSYDWKI